ncbi:MAG: penicillin-binding transpeptidase domain-containing protein, partial [Candidatus Roizmanbacteria bacterium]|nr:penicillin-binding transpeptidase domain-containing protein [Candidatus Roizmanbacteria bacterium]
DASCVKLPMSTATYDVVREGMHKACSTGGTGYPFFDFSVQENSAVQQLSNSANQQLSNSATQQENVATSSASIQRRIEVGCKTGTAESHAKSKDPHAWFTVFAPFEHPEIVLTVLVEEGGQGSEVAAPIAKEILKVYFERYE